MIAALGVGSVMAGRYELVCHIARGGMADVYEAEDRQLQRAVAIKVFRGGAAADRARFDAEVVVLAALNHPGLVQVFDAGEDDGHAFVVLDLVNGPTLAARLASGGPIPPTETAELGAQVADALAYVHEQGVVHRDVTPANVLCGPDDRALLADFGISRLIDARRVTAAATTVGTAAYMAPEQVQGHDVTPAADVYSLGLVLLELLTGRKAFTGTAQETAVARLVRDPDTNTDVPHAWQVLLHDMTERAASNRPSAANVRDRLRAMTLITGTRTALLAAVGPTSVAAPDASEDATTDASITPMPTADGTTVMPASLRPSRAPGLTRMRLMVAAVVVGVLIFIALAAVAADDEGVNSETPPSTTEPVVATSTPTTTVPTTEAPVTAQEKPKDRGNGNGKGNGKANANGARN